MAAVVVLAIVIFVATFDANRYKPRIEEAAFEATGMTVRIKGDISLKIFPSVGVSIEDILIQNKSSEVASAKRAEVKMELLPLIRKEVRISQVGLVSPEVFIVKDNRGRFNFETPDRKPKKSSAKAVEVAKIYVKKAHLGYLDERTGVKSEASGCDVSIKNLVVPGGEPVASSSFDGDLSCKEVKSKGVEISDVNVDIKAAGGNIEADPINMTIFGGNGSGRASLSGLTPGKTPDYKVDFAIKKFRSEDVFLALKQKKSISGELNMDLHLAMKGKSAKEMTRTANGDVSLRGDDLVYEGMDFDGVFEKYEETQRIGLVDMGAFFVVGPFGPLLTKGYDYGGVYAASRGGKSVIQRLVSDWKVKGGVAEAKDVAFSTKKNRIAMKGRLDIANERLDDVIVAVLDEKGCAKFKQEIHGTFKNPRIEKVSTLKSLTGPVAGLFAKTKNLFIEDECAAFYEGSVKHPR